MENKNKSIYKVKDEIAQNSNDNELENQEKSEFILERMEKLSIADFPADIPQKSKQNIEKAIRAVKMRKSIDLGNGQTLLGLDEYRIENLQLSYQEKKFIGEQVQRLIDLEDQKLPDYSSSQELDKLVDKFVEKQKEMISLTEKLLMLKCEELELLLESAEEIVSPTQLKQVEMLQQKSKIHLLQIKIFNQTIQESQTSKTRESKVALQQVSLFLDSMLEDFKNEQE